MRYVFDDYELNIHTRELRRAGVPIALTPKAYAVLAYLLHHRERLVSKEELLEEVWPHTYVDDSAVKRNIMAVRQAIGDRAGAPQRIKTHRGQGYRFMASVTVHTSPAPESPSQETASPAAAPEAHVTEVGEGDSPTDRPQVRDGPFRCTAAGERKLITALYGTVADAPHRLEGLELDAWHRLMQRVYELALAQGQRYGGTIHSTTGEGFLLVFGAPTAQEDHAQRAVLTALGLQRQLHAQQPALRLQSGEPVRLCMALHTGLVVIGQLQDASPGLATVVGKVTTLAATLAQQAPPDTILASAATMRLLQGDVRIQKRAPLRVQAQAPPMTVYEILAFLPSGGPRAVTPAHPRSPFVGRAAELTMLQTRLAQAAQGQGHVVGIIGEPGMGKSRLLDEFHQGLSTRHVRYLQCRCHSYGHATPYAPILDLLRITWGLIETDDTTTSWAKIQQGLQSAQLDPEALGPYFLSLLDVSAAPHGATDVSPEVFKARTFAALHQFFLHSSRPQPCVLEVENVHWIDATSDAYLTALVERLAGAPLLLLVTFRPGYRPVWLDKSYATQVALQPLGHEASRQVLQAVLGDTPVPDALAQQLLNKAAGNPFFLEELARTVVEQRGHQPRLVVPETVHAVLAARIDRLPPAEKQLLQTAAVIGSEVPVPLLHTLSGHTEADLHRMLAHLQAAEFLHETSLFPDHIYTFKHTLTRDVVYANLLQDQRQALHARVVDALETRYHGDARLTEQADLLAYHALGGELWDQASHYFAQAGAKAMARSAYREAITCFAQALYSLHQVSTSQVVREPAIDLRLNLHNALLRIGEVARALAVLREAEPLAEALDDACRLGWLSSYISTHYLMAGDSDRAIACGQRAQALAAACEDETLHVDVRLHLGQAYHVRGAYQQATELLRHNVEVCADASRQASTHPTTLPGMHSFAWLILCLAETGAFSEGLRYAEKALQIIDPGDRPYDQVAVSGSVGVLYLRQGQLPEALATLERCRDVCRAANIPHLLPMITAHLGAAYVLCERIAEAIPLLEHAVAQASARHVMAYHALAVLYLSHAYLRSGRRHDAREYALCALKLCQRHKEWGHQAWCLWLLGEIAAAAQPPDLEQAESSYRQALTQANDLGMRPLQAHCHLSLSTLYRQHGKGLQARSELSAALPLYRSMHMTHWLSQAEHALTQVSPPPQV